MGLSLPLSLLTLLSLFNPIYEIAVQMMLGHPLWIVPELASTIKESFPDLEITNEDLAKILETLKSNATLRYKHTPESPHG